ncbi:MAG: hypothetical protein IJC43_05255, partial [Clostridia bacterium]|nr:hypothetical protein [Clostridia bacterium]
MHMTCEQARQAAELPPSERGEPLSLALDQHLNGCETCRQSLLPDLRLEAWWEAVEQDVPAGLSERIMAAVRREVISETAPPETLPVMEFLRADEEQAPYEADGKVIPLQTAQPSAQTALYSAPSWQKGRKKRRRMARQEKRRWTSFAAALAVLLLTPTLLHAVQRLTPLMDGGAETAQMEAVVEGSYGSSAGAATGPAGGAGAQAAEVPPAANDVRTADPPGEPATEEPVPQPLYAEMSPAPNGDANEFNYSTDGDASAAEIGSSSPDVTMRAQEDGGVDPLMVSKRLSLPA